jgi:hypothetical protein
MDAVKPLWQLFIVTVLKRPGIFALLTLFYLVGLFVAAGSARRDIWLGLAVLFAFPTAGIAGVVTERLGLLCESAGALGIPCHAERVRRFQLLALLIIAIPVVLAAAAGENVLPVAAILGGAAVLGVWLASRGFFVVVCIVAAILLRDFAGWLENSYVQAGLLAFELWVLTRWLRMPFDVEAAAAVQVRTLADARHEDLEKPREGAVPEPEQPSAYDLALDEMVAKHGYRAGHPTTAADLGFALGLDAPASLRAKLIWTGVACAVVLVSHFLRESVAGYVAVLFVASIMAFNRASVLYEAWRGSGGEQSLLHLAPSWPRPDALKPALATMVAECLPGAWLVWLVTTAVALAVGVIPAAGAVWSLSGMAAVSATIVGSLGAVLTRPKRRNWRLSSVLAFVVAATGSVALAAAQLGVPLFVALVLLVAPAVVGGVLFWRRSLPFPVNLVR